MQVVRRVMRSLVPGLKPVLRPPLARLEGVTYTDDPVIERLVFICGLHRSGTTALERPAGFALPGRVPARKPARE